MDFIWQGLIDFVATHFYVSPFWYYVFVGGVIIAAVSVASWDFAVLRTLAGAIVFAVVAGLFGYRRGETDAEKHQNKVDARKQEPKQDGWW